MPLARSPPVFKDAACGECDLHGYFISRRTAIPGVCWRKSPEFLCNYMYNHHVYIPYIYIYTMIFHDIFRAWFDFHHFDVMGFPIMKFITILLPGRPGFLGRDVWRRCRVLIRVEFWMALDYPFCIAVITSQRLFELIPNYPTLNSSRF